MSGKRITNQNESAVLENEIDDEGHQDGGTENERESDHDETPEESARAALAELQAGNSQDGDQNAEGANAGDSVQSTTTDPKVAKSKQPQNDSAQADDDFEIPARLNPRERGLYGKLPKEFQPAVTRMFKEHQANDTRREREHRSAVSEAQHIVQAVRPYLLSNPQYAQAGITESNFIASLVGAHQMLTDPKTCRQTLESIARDQGFQIKFLDSEGNELEGGGSQKPAPVDIENHPKFRALQDEVSSLRSEKNGERANAIAAPIVSEWKTLREQKDHRGNYVYAEMHDDSFWERATPLILNLCDQGIHHNEAAIRVWTALTGKNRPQAQNQTRPTSTNNNQTTRRAMPAPNSVRGRTAPMQLNTHAESSSVPIGDDESPADSARIALEEIRRGIS